MEHIDLTGRQFGEWVVLEPCGQDKWLCKCSCGTIKQVSGRNLRAGKTKCCGCKGKNYRQDLSGKTFGQWTVIDYAGNHKWNCVCSCGKHAQVFSQNLLKGRSTSCGCANVVDIQGKRYGLLTVLEKNGRDKNGRTLWLCKCDCGNIVTVSGKSLRSGNTTSCGRKNANKTADLTGKRFGRLVVLKREDIISKSGKKSVAWRCKCDCGNYTVIRAGNLASGSTKSCGCLANECNPPIMVKHNGSKSRLYSIWKGIKGRCLNKNLKAYHYYGGRGIKICDEWKNDFASFRDWALQNGYSKNLTIDRIDVNGNYEPSNCRWATWKEQANNTRSNRYINYKGKKYSLSEGARLANMDYRIFCNRLYNGWSVEKAVESPWKRIKKEVSRGVEE